MRVEGYAATFEPYFLFETDEYTIYEQIDPGAFKSANMRDVVMLFDHAGDVLARTTNRTLQLDVDRKGLHVVARLDGTQAGRNRYEEIKGEYLTQMSFAFFVGKDRREVIKEVKSGTRYHPEDNNKYFKGCGCQCCDQTGEPRNRNSCAHAHAGRT